MLYVHKLSGGGQVSLSYIFAVCGTVGTKLRISVPSAVVNRKKSPAPNTERKDLQEAVLVKDACGICFHMYFNELVHVN